MTINEIINSVVALKEEYRMNSIDPQRLGDIMLNILQYINSSQVRMQSPAIHKLYSSVSAMQSDAKPVSDLTGLEMKVGQLVCIVPASSSEATAGDVYRYDGPSGNTSAWTYVGKIGGIPADQELNETSTNPVANAPVARKLAQLSQEWQELKDKNFQIQPHIDKVVMTETTAELQPDKFYLFGEVSALNITLAPVEEGYASQYIFQFTSPLEAPTTLSMPVTIIWADIPTIKGGMTYQVSVVEGLAMITGWTTAIEE